MQRESISELYNEFQNTSSEIMNEMNTLLKIVLNQSDNDNIEETKTQDNMNNMNNPSVDESVKMEVIYPMNYENVCNISIKKRFMILNSCNLISLLFDTIWNAKYNKNFVKVLNYSQVIYFFNSNITYTNTHETYSYEFFFNRIIEVLYEFLYDLHIEYKLKNNTNNDDTDNILFYISKIRKIEKEGYRPYINIIKNKIREKNIEYISNKIIIERYEKHLTRKNNGNYTEEYLNLKNYVNEYNKKKSRIHIFMNLYIIKYENKIKDIEKEKFESLYLIPEFLL